MPNREPKFHKNEMFEGDGRSIREELMIFIMGCVWRIGRMFEFLELTKLLFLIN
jgi:hypothetical protein